MYFSNKTSPKKKQIPSLKQMRSLSFLTTLINRKITAAGQFFARHHSKRRRRVVNGTIGNAQPSLPKKNLQKHSKLYYKRTQSAQFSPEFSTPLRLSSQSAYLLASAGFKKLDDEHARGATALTQPLAIRAACPAITTILHKNATPTPCFKKKNLNQLLRTNNK